MKTNPIKLTSLQNRCSDFRQKSGRSPLAEEAALDRAAVTTDRVWCRELRRFLLPSLIAGLGLIAAGRVAAQTFTTLHSFKAATGPDYTNSDGDQPWAGLITNSAGNTLYGTTAGGGSANAGTVFAVNTDGTGFTNLYSFSADPEPDYTNSDGASPFAGLALSGNTLYGTARDGGSSGHGTVFAVNTDGTGFTNLHTFTGSDGGSPYAGLILSGDTLYGTAGTVFKLNLDGTGFTNLHRFTGSDGGGPNGLLLSGDTLYGTAAGGGSGGAGTVFALKADGTEFTNLYSFTATSGPHLTNSDGAYPQAGLILAGNTLYGTAFGGGSSGNGTVFAVNTKGTGFTNLHSFTIGSGPLDLPSNSDGVNPQAGLVLSGNTLYGTARQGGTSGNGTVFAINTNGADFTTLHSFTATACDSCPNSDGINPLAGLVLSGNTLYGTAAKGGTSGYGTVFSLSFPPQLSITFPGDRPVLTWPVNHAGFTYTGYHLQYTRGADFSGVWLDLVYLPAILDGQFSVAVPWTLFLGQSASSFRLVQ
jgi:uncharacterized repeat protein (TIGR03803 family)